MKVNLTLVFITVAVTAIIGFAGAVVIILSGNDPKDFYSFLTVTMTAVIGFGGTIYGLTKINTNTEQVKANVNGNLSKLIDLATANATTRGELAEVRAISERTGVTGSTGNIPTV